MSKFTGTFNITLQGKEYTLRPSFEALIDFEENTGKAVNEAFDEMREGKMSFKTIASAIWAGINGEASYRNDKSYSEKFIVVGEKIRKDGLARHVANATEFFTMALISEEANQKIAEESDDDSSKKNT